jgi:branched-chain amino acid transport system ATP-binding protein
MTMLETRSLMKSFGGIRATDDLTLSVEPGELHAIIGPNGAGKTTLITQLCGSQRPDSGTILYKGQDITRVPAHKRARLGITRSFQITSLILDMTVIDNIALAVQARQGSSFRLVRNARKIPAIRDRAMELLARVGLSDKAHMVTSALSHGEHRHIEIAIALADRISVLVYGHIIATGSPAEIRANKDVEAAYLGEESGAA